MRVSILTTLFFILTINQSFYQSNACTTIIAGKTAMANGAPVVTHNNDCTDCDVRITVVPSRSVGSEDAILPCKFGFPRYVGDDRSVHYSIEATESEDVKFNETIKPTKPLGYFNLSDSSLFRDRTYSYIDGTYGIANEVGLIMGESTCTASLVSYGLPAGDAMFDVSSLMRIALEHCDNARCAVTLMGELAEKYGYYGADDPPESGTGLFEEAGEAITIVDAVGEAWVFHILPDDTGLSAVWAAQRLRDDEISIVPNKFVIREMDLDNKDYFLASKNVVDCAVRAGLWPKDSKKPFDFSGAYAPDAYEPMGWADRRTWHIFTWAAPSTKLPPNRAEPYPFAVKVDKPLSMQDLFAMSRDHFEGTEYDLTKGPASGPYNSPTRYDRGRDPVYAGGYFERAISLHRTTYSFVGESRVDVPAEAAGVVHFAHHSPHSSLFVPLYSASTQLDDSFATGNLFNFNRHSAWWVSAAVTQFVEREYGHIHPYVAERQKQLESEFADQIAVVDKSLKSSHSQNQRAVTAFTVNATQQFTQNWWKFFENLHVMFRDGQKITITQPPFDSVSLFYSPEWLKTVNFYIGEYPPSGTDDLVPPPIPHADAIQTSSLSQRFNTHPALGRGNVLTFNDIKSSTFVSKSASAPVPNSSMWSGAQLAAFSVFLMAVAFVAGRKYEQKEQRDRGQYTPIESSVDDY